VAFDEVCEVADVWVVMVTDVAGDSDEKTREGGRGMGTC
jgi:hypothetical protein